VNITGMIKNTAAVAGIAALSVGAVAVGTIVTRHPETARRALRILMQSAQRMGVALAQSREDFGDLWAEVRDELRADMDFGRIRQAAQSWGWSRQGAEQETPAKSNGARKSRMSAAQATRTRGGRSSKNGVSEATPERTASRRGSTRTGKTTRKSTARGGAKE